MQDTMTHTPPPDLSDPATRRRVNISIAAVLLALMLSALNENIVATALPTIVSDLGGLEHLSWAVTAYFLASTVVLPVYGKLGDVFGRKLMLQAAVVIFLLGTVLCAVAQNMTQLMIFRGLQGIGGGGLTVITMTTIAELVPLRERGRYQGVSGAVFGVATVIGPLIGGLCVDHLTWRWIFYVNLPLGMIALVALSIVLPRPPALSGRPAIDYLGAILLGSALTALVLLSSFAGAATQGRSLEIIGLAVLTLACVGAFLVVERSAPDAMLPLSLFSFRAFSVSTCVGLTMGIGLSSTVYLPLYLQAVKGLSPSASGLTIMPLMAGVITSSMVSGRIIARTGRYKIFPLIGTAVTTCALVAFAVVPTAAPNWTMVACSAVLGLGMGMVMQVITLATQNAVPRHQMGAATASVTLARSVGMTAGVAAFGTLMNLWLGARLGAGAAEGPQFDLAALAGAAPGERAELVAALSGALHLVFAGGAAMYALAFLTAWALPDTRLPTAPKRRRS